MDLVIRYEGGYVNDPDDPGKETKWGISKRQYPDLDIASLTREDAEDIYHRDYWMPIQGDKLHPRVAEELFEQAVNCGVKRAVIHAQNALNYFGEGLEVDGIMGPKTIAGLLKWTRTDLNALLKALNGEQFVYYRSLSPKLRQRFAHGWLRRIA